ncbi:hypothetical protein CLV49_0853 [Labedella gwakjiensis]|uniref:Uncharacterized protein n=1 Tax=Labedella gwakjiensis TaxID=390269 RepID=A0A2P8GTE4_9MICO|nr:hypothetical protein CLV49_0853 [Labedella gwakjiensis]
MVPRGTTATRTTSTDRPVTDLLHVAALLPATLGVCCTAGRRRIGAELWAAIVMLVVMVDLALGVVSVPPVVWTAVLVATALGVVALGGRSGEDTHPERTGQGSGSARRRSNGMVALVAVGSLVMAGLAALMAASVGGAVGHTSTAGVGTGHHAATSLTGLLPSVVLMASAVFTIVVMGVAVQAARERRSRLEIAELGSMAASVALMALAVSA